MRLRLMAVVALLVVSACSPGERTSDGGTTGDEDAGSPRDAGQPAPDAGRMAGTACAAVGALAVTSTSATAVGLSWTGGPGVTIGIARETYCSTDDYVTLATLDAGATSFTDDTVQDQWVYWYKVTATDSTGMIASAAIATQAALMPVAACSPGATPRPSGESTSACAPDADGGRPLDAGSPADAGSPVDDAGSPVAILNGNPCPIAAGASQSTIQATLDSCGSGNTAVFAAGSYDIGSTLSWPCGVSVSGPTPAGVLIPSGSGSTSVFPGPYTATLNWTGGGGSWVLKYPSGCSVSGVVFQFMNVNGNRPNGGGGGSINLGNGGGTGPTIQFNYFHGVQSDSGGDCCSDGLIYVDGTGTAQGHSIWTDLIINWNTFGAVGDCSVLMNTFSYNGTNYNNYGGYCDAVDLHSSTVNLTIEYNKTIYLEQGFKFQEPGPNGGQTGNPAQNQYMHANANVNYNDFAGIHRITIEAQDTPDSTENFNYNDWHDPVDPGYGSWTFSLPQYDGSGASYTNLNTNVSYNVFASNVTTGSGGGYIPGVEFWSTGQANYNLFQGNLACGVQFGYGNSPWQIDNNTVQGNFPVACSEENQNTNPNPQQTGNSSTGTVSALTSVAPVISISGGRVIFTNPGTNRDVNTGIWYTTDGSTPVPGAGTAQFTLSGGTITVPAQTTVKAVGMWGQYNQPRSYPSGFGYVPSNVVMMTATGP